MNQSDNPQLWMIAGPNGAGKSTIVKRFQMDMRLQLINPDVIAKEISPENPTAAGVALQAGRQALRQQNECLAKRQSFVIETTMSGKRELELLREARDAGFKVNLVYCGVSTPFYSLSRVKTRVAMGGHYVPPVDIIRRFGRSMEHLPEALKIVDRAYVCDNTGLKHRLAVTVEEGIPRFCSEEQPEWFKKACPELLP